MQREEKSRIEKEEKNNYIHDKKIHNALNRLYFYCYWTRRIFSA